MEESNNGNELISVVMTREQWRNACGFLLTKQNMYERAKDAWNDLLQEEDQSFKECDVENARTIVKYLSDSIVCLEDIICTIDKAMNESAERKDSTDINKERRCVTLTNEQWRNLVMCIEQVQDLYNEGREYLEKRFFDINVSEPEREEAESIANSYTDDIDKLEEARLTICEVTSEAKRRASDDNYVKDIAEIKISVILTEEQWQKVTKCIVLMQLRYNEQRCECLKETPEYVKAESVVNSYTDDIYKLEEIKTAICEGVSAEQTEAEESEAGT